MRKRMTRRHGPAGGGLARVDLPARNAQGPTRDHARPDAEKCARIRFGAIMHDHASAQLIAQIAVKPDTRRTGCAFRQSSKYPDGKSL